MAPLKVNGVGPLNGRGKVLSEINGHRFDALTPHILNGGKCDVVLRCGDGNFAIALAEKTQRWVIGIDEVPDQMLGNQELSDRYQKVDTVIYLPYSHEMVQTCLSTPVLKWLAGSAQRTHMNMPDVKKTYTEEVALWLKLVSQDKGRPGELHIRTGSSKVISHFKNADNFDPFKIREIPFDEEAKDVISPEANRYLRSGQELHTLGIRLVV